MKRGFIERTIASLLAASEYTASAERMAASGGLLQQVDPRVKVGGLFGLVFVVAASHQIEAIAGIFVLAFALALLSRVRLARLVTWVWLPVLFFTGSIAAPAIFITPGTTVLSIGPMAVTAQGIRSAGFLVSRAETAATLSSLLVLTTPWPWVLKSLRSFRCPVVLVAILGMTYRYIFVILQSALDMFESRKSRTVGILSPPERRKLAASAAGVLLSKSLQLSGDVHLAMQSRGFRGEIHILQDFCVRMADWVWLAGFTSVAILAIRWGT